MPRTARKTWETLRAIDLTLGKLHENYTHQERALAEATFRSAIRDLRNDMDRMAQSRGIIRRLTGYLRLIFESRARERYHVFQQVKVGALGDLLRLREIPDNYTRR